MKRVKLLLVSLAVVSLFAVPGMTWAAAIEINQFLLNPSFELGADKACPTSWACTGSTGVAAYTPTTAQFTPVTDGIPGIVPDGARAAYDPAGAGGGGVLTQAGSSAHTWIAGQQYTFTFWTGLPNKEPDGTTSVAGWPSGVFVNILTNGASFSTPLLFSIPSPGAGQWRQVTETFTPAVGGGNIGVQFLVSATAGSNTEANFDITPVPEPATMFLGGLGLIAFGYAARRRLFGR